MKILTEQEIDKEIDGLYEGLFDKIKGAVGLGGGKSEYPKISKNGNVEMLSSNHFIVNGNEVLYWKDSGPSGEVLMNKLEDLDKTSLSWLFDGKYKAQYIYTELSKNIIHNFAGEWNEGEFDGGENTWFSMKSTVKIDASKIGFNGGVFTNGILDVGYNYWNTSPKNFISGEIKEVAKKGGVLGLKNVGVGVQEDMFNLIQVPEKYSIIIKMVGSSTLNTIRVNKRFDGKENLFSYTNINAEKTQDMDWETIRVNYDNLFLKKGQKGFYLPGVLKLNGIIDSIEVVSRVNDELLANKQIKTSKSKVGDYYKLNFTRFPLFKEFTDIIIDPDYLEKDEDKKSFNIIKSDLNDKGGKNLSKALYDLKSDIQYGINLKSVQKYKNIYKLVGEFNKRNELGNPNGIDIEDIIPSISYINSLLRVYAKNFGDTSIENKFYEKILSFFQDGMNKKTIDQEEKPSEIEKLTKLLKAQQENPENAKVNKPTAKSLKEQEDIFNNLNNILNNL